MDFLQDFARRGAGVQPFLRGSPQVRKGLSRVAEKHYPEARNNRIESRRLKRMYLCVCAQKGWKRCPPVRRDFGQRRSSDSKYRCLCNRPLLRGGERWQVLCSRCRSPRPATVVLICQRTLRRADRPADFRTVQIVGRADPELPPKHVRLGRSTALSVLRRLNTTDSWSSLVASMRQQSYSATSSRLEVKR